jgi:hypothetical protein
MWPGRGWRGPSPSCCGPGPGSAGISGPQLWAVQSYSRSYKIIFLSPLLRFLKGGGAAGELPTRLFPNRPDATFAFSMVSGRERIRQKSSELMQYFRVGGLSWIWNLLWMPTGPTCQASWAACVDGLSSGSASGALRLIALPPPQPPGTASGGMEGYRNGSGLSQQAFSVRSHLQTA